MGTMLYYELDVYTVDFMEGMVYDATVEFAKQVVTIVITQQLPIY